MIPEKPDIAKTLKYFEHFEHQHLAGCQGDLELRVITVLTDDGFETRRQLRCLVCGNGIAVAIEHDDPQLLERFGKYEKGK